MAHDIATRKATSLAFHYSMCLIVKAAACCLFAKEFLELLMSNYLFNAFEEKCSNVLAAHGINAATNTFGFSDEARATAVTGNWDRCAIEMRDMTASILAPQLAPWHAFVDAPYVRKLTLKDGTPLSLAIINEQSRDWYGGDSFFASCDFLVEKDRGCFSRAFRFADLGGHQLVWAIYYAKTSKLSSVISYEPSVLNCLIGLFNCLVNDVVDRIEVVPFAVSVNDSTSEGAEGDKMLVDFMTLPIKTVTLGETMRDRMDFVKVDIEGYEYELLADKSFVQLLKSVPYAHLEMHLGHLIKRGVSREACVEAMRAAGLEGVELYSGDEMYKFLEGCDRNSYPAFILKN